MIKYYERLKSLVHQLLKIAAEQVNLVIPEQVVIVSIFWLWILIFDCLWKCFYKTSGVRRQDCMGLRDFSEKLPRIKELFQEFLYFSLYFFFTKKLLIISISLKTNNLKKSIPEKVRQAGNLSWSLCVQNSGRNLSIRCNTK